MCLTAVAARPNFVLVLWEWSSAKCLTRTWCLWEIASAVRSGLDVTFALPRTERLKLRDALLKDAHSVQKTLIAVDAAKSKARDEVTISITLKQYPTRLRYLVV